jgi:hypothetical protein
MVDLVPAMTVVNAAAIQLYHCFQFFFKLTYISWMYPFIKQKNKLQINSFSFLNWRTNGNKMDSNLKKCNWNCLGASERKHNQTVPPPGSRSHFLELQKISQHSFLWWQLLTAMSASCSIVELWGKFWIVVSTNDFTKHYWKVNWNYHLLMATNMVPVPWIIAKNLPFEKIFQTVQRKGV